MADIQNNSDEIINLSRDIVTNDYKSAVNANRELFINGDVMASSEYIFDNQKEDAIVICNKFYTTQIRGIVQQPKTIVRVLKKHL
jgi:hypothetical protein